jgi:ferredoxin
MLRKIRITLEVIFFVLITLLFLDFTGTIQTYFSWMAKIQFLPAILAMNVAIVVALLLLTLIFGRIYCSVICPLGVMQDIISHFKAKRKRNRFNFTPEKRILRLVVLIVFIILLVVGLGSIAGLIAPYSAYGRIASNIFAPVYQLGNDCLAYIATRLDSYAFYKANYVWMKSIITFVIALLTLVVIGFLAWKDGRIYCNTICPVGTVLGFVSRFSLFKLTFDLSKCNGCKLCARNCKSSCINPEKHEIDYSRCVACMDCINNCHQSAISYKFLPKDVVKADANHHDANIADEDKSRRTFLTLAGTVAVAATVKAQKKNVDGGLAVLKDKKMPDRKTKLTPPGSLSAAHLQQHCTACQLCISECPNQVLRPSTGLLTLMQPEMEFDKGACRPECTRCSEVCPTGAIQPITRAEKSSIQIGHAVWIKKNCLINTDGVPCGNCARHCPNGAIRMAPQDPNDEYSVEVPVVDISRCIGCGMCESVCPARPFTAIHVEGHLVHKHI